MDLSGMDKILSINGECVFLLRGRRGANDLVIVDDADLVCQAGARWEDINHHLQDEGIPLFFPVRSSSSPCPHARHISCTA